jgi:hypothetical protein
MPDWILGPICAVLLVSFIFYAFRQGMKVKPDRNDSNVGATTNDIWLERDLASSDGGSDTGGHSD